VRSAIGEGKIDNLFKKVREEEKHGKRREGERQREYTTGRKFIKQIFKIRFLYYIIVKCRIKVKVTQKRLKDNSK
jgi:hypothetical protein